MIRDHGIYIIFCNIHPFNIDPLNRVGLLSDVKVNDDQKNNNYFKYFNKYDSAIEWCENKVIYFILCINMFYQ